MNKLFRKFAISSFLLCDPGTNVERTGELNLVVKANDKRVTWVQTYHSLYIVFLQIGDWLSDCTQRWSRLISGPSENGKILEWPD